MRLCTCKLNVSVSYDEISFYGFNLISRNGWKIVKENSSISLFHLEWHERECVVDVKNAEKIMLSLMFKLIKFHRWRLTNISFNMLTVETRPQCYARTDSNIQTTHVRLIKKILWVNKSLVLLLAFTSTFIFISLVLSHSIVCFLFFQFRIILFAENIICS